MQYGDLIVIGEDAVTIISKDATNPGHAQTMEFGGSQRADAGAAVDVDPLRHRPQDFLMPNRRADDRRAGQGRPVHLALLDWRRHSRTGSDGRTAGGSDEPAKMMAVRETQLIAAAPLPTALSGRERNAGA